MPRNVIYRKTLLAQHRPSPAARQRVFIVGMGLILLSATSLVLFSPLPEDSAPAFHAPPKQDTGRAAHRKWTSPESRGPCHTRH